MYLSTITIENFRCFGEGAKRLELSLSRGLTALVGENDSGKTAVIDALRFVLGTTDQEWYRLEDTDFHGEGTMCEIKIVCAFKGLSDSDKRAFVEYLTYSETGEGEPVLYVNWSAKDTGETYRGRSYRRVDVHSGKDGNGPSMASEARDLLRATYLRPLRDAEYSLSAGRGSRLSQVFHHKSAIKEGGKTYDPNWDLDTIDSKILKQLNILGIGDLANALLENQREVLGARREINRHLKGLALSGETLESSIKVSGTAASDEQRLRQLLEKLDLSLSGSGKLGLGSNNLLFMACELLLLVQEEVGNKLLLIEEPEAHLHAQRQLRVMKFLQEQAKENGIQIIVTTHSPNLASAIELNNLVMLNNGRAFSMAEGKTELEPSDYQFLQRFLDVTKANLFFAHGVMIVEGDAENILLPTLANLIGRDFTEHGVSIVNVGGVGLRRYARIFQRKDLKKDGQLDIPVACVTDMDVMPDCAPVIIGKLQEGEAWPKKNSKRRWRAKRDIGDSDALIKHREAIVAKASGQGVRSFVSDEWTLEYDLSLGSKHQNGSFTGGLAVDVFAAACRADKDDAINAKTKEVADVDRTSDEAFDALREAAIPEDGCTAKEVLASNVYAKFARNRISKAIAAQYLAERLEDKYGKNQKSRDELRTKLPKYLIDAIDYVTGFGKEDDAPSADRDAQ